MWLVRTDDQVTVATGCKFMMECGLKKENLLASISSGRGLHIKSSPSKVFQYIGYNR